MASFYSPPCPWEGKASLIPILQKTGWAGQGPHQRRLSDLPVSVCVSVSLFFSLSFSPSLSLFYSTPVTPPPRSSPFPTGYVPTSDPLHLLFALPSTLFSQSFARLSPSLFKCHLLREALPDLPA